MLRWAGVIGFAAWLAGCAALGMADDGTSVSLGPPGRGALLNPDELPVSGEGYWMPPTWAHRGLRYGTTEMVAFVVHLGRELEPANLGRPLAVADLSPARGGPSAWHRSHQTGRDVDLLFYARDAAGRPVVADAMRRYGADGLSLPGSGAPPAHFDDRANWTLVRAILEDPVADVEYIFISDDLKQRILDAATTARAPADLIAAAAELLHQPSAGLIHDDHMHVRIYCAPTDRPLGCREAGSLRWYKKSYKYRTNQLHRATEQALAGRLPPVLPLPLPGLLVRGFVPR
ncbi:MAG TPA: penicillin-insensitive murein endopeptidase [Kofleriaceae bacterium]|nr:penicillin-insensitive murein endopeptidase [Kofleriaceae bacterium]